MRIIHLLASPVFSGPAELVLELAKQQREQGHQVKVALDRKRLETTSEEPAVPRFEAEGLLYPDGLELSVHSSWLQMWRDVRQLGRLDVDVVHCHFSHDHWIARWGKPSRAVVIRSIHAPRSARPGMPRADGYTVPYRGLSWPRRPVVVLPPLLAERFRPAVDREALRAELDINGQPLIGMVSTFQASRRHDIALAALLQLRTQRPGARLVLVGDGALEGQLRAEVQRRQLGDAVRFAGYRSGEDFVRHLQAFDEVWVLGLGNDWSGRAAAQARACGARVVVVDEGGLAELADEVVNTLSPTAVAAASLNGQRLEKKLPEATRVARQIDELYRNARSAR